MARSEERRAPASALAGDVGDVQGEAGAPLARTSDEGALGRAPRTRTEPVVSLDVLNAANVAGRGASHTKIARVAPNPRRVVPQATCGSTPRTWADASRRPASPIHIGPMNS